MLTHDHYVGGFVSMCIRVDNSVGPGSGSLFILVRVFITRAKVFTPGLGDGHRNILGLVTDTGHGH